MSEKRRPMALYIRAPSLWTLVRLLATQYLGYTYFVAATEAFLMASKAGVDIKTLAEIIPVSAGRGNIGSFTNSVFKRNFDGQGSLDIIVKDMHLACEIAHKVQSPA